jgi:BlaI family transcriptional regulator, penicillinase repressor
VSAPFGRGLSRRERQILEILYARGKATAAEVQELIPDPPGYSSVRTLLRILEEKGHARHVREGARYVYLPTQPRVSAAKAALTQVVQTFFGGSVEEAVATLVSSEEARISREELSRLAALIEDARRKGESDEP